MSLILVSHDLVAVKALCRRAIVLHEGHVSFVGPSAEAVSHYHQLHRGRIGSSPGEATAETMLNSNIVLPPGAREQ